MTDIPGRARIVIIGGGVIGTSVAYHLTALGQSDVLLLEQGSLSGGTTWHAAGLVGQLRASESGTRLVQYSTRLYERLEDEVGLATGFRRCGGVTVARTEDRMIQLRRTAANAAAYGIDCEIISPAQAADRFPLLRIDDLLGAIWLPGDGRVNPSDLTSALARGARLGGARILERARVVDITTAAPSVTGRTASAGEQVAAVVVHAGGDLHRVEAEIVVNCAGQWAKVVGALAGVTVPLHSAEHFYVVTDQIPGVHRDLPILRDPDGYTYIKEEVGGLVVGGFEPVAKPWVSPEDIPYPFEYQLLEEDWEHFSVLMDSAVHRLPVLDKAGIRRFYNGPESFTPDNQFILGEAPELRNFYVAAGFNSVGIASAGGAGMALAEWICAGEPTMDLTVVDPQRFAPFNGNSRWLRDRVGEVLGLHYAIGWPNRELASARPFRRSPVHEVVAEAGAGFGSKMGWERPNYFAPRGVSPEIRYSWGRQNWHEWVNEEQRATREAVALFDETSFGKLLVTGPDSESALQWVCAGDVAVEPGRSVYTPMLNSRGGYEADVTVTRLSPTEYLLITGAASVVRDRVHVLRNAPPGSRIDVVDVSSAWAVFGLMGPRSRELLAELSRSDLSDEAFPFGSSRLVDVGTSIVRATRITYVGELGWELYVPTEFARGVFTDLTVAGARWGLRHAGYYAMNALRLEKGYRAFGSDLTPDVTPHEAGLTFATKFNMQLDYLGRTGMEKVAEQGPRRRLVSLSFHDPEPIAWGGELLLRDGVPVGQLTSAAWGAAVGRTVGLTNVWRPDGGPVTGNDLAGPGFEVDVAGIRYPVTLSRKPLYDPTGARIRR